MIDAPLEPAAQGLEEHRDDAGCNEGNDQVAPGTKNDAEIADDQDIEPDHYGGEGSIDQRAADEHIDVEGIGVQGSHQEASDIDPAAEEAERIDGEEGEGSRRRDGGQDAGHEHNAWDEDAPTQDEPFHGDALFGVQETAIAIDQNPQNKGKADRPPYIVEQDENGIRDEDGK